MTGWSTDLVDAQITFRGLDDWLIEGVNLQIALPVANLNHPNCVVWAVVCTAAAPNAGLVVNDDVTLQLIAVNCPGRTFNHAYRILAVHAGIRDHVVLMDGSMSNKPRVVVMSIRAGSNTVIATRTAIEINHH